MKGNIKLKSSPSPTETLEIENGLSLIPRLKLHLSITRADLSVKPIDEWQLKCSLLEYLKSSLSIPHIVPEEDLDLHKFTDLKKRNREDPVASGVLYIRDLGFLNRNSFNKEKIKEDDDVEGLEKKFLEWRKSFVEKLDGIELSLKGVKFKLNVKLPESDDFEGLNKSWEEFYAFSSNNKGYTSRSGKQQPDTIILRGLPSRWFAETRVSSKPSMLVTHTIFSVFGKIRNLSVGSDDEVDGVQEEAILSGLQCKIIVQFQNHDIFCSALKSLCGRSMQKEGSRLRAEYEVTWDRNNFFRNSSSKSNKISESNRYEDEAPRYRERSRRFDYNASSEPSKRFKETRG
ncbi:hypothetical protein ACHQM5_024882 [Ranunculus cassubicifolius]